MVLAGELCGARRRAEILGADPLVHTRHVVGAGERIGERGEHRSLHLAGQWLGLPYRAHLALGLGAVALRDLHTGEREPAGGLAGLSPVKA